MKEIVIIGNGVAGITAARHIRKRGDYRIRVISSETEHFFSRTALMYIYMGHMEYRHTKPYEDFFWSKNNIELVYDHVDQIDFKRKTLHIQSADAEIQYDKLILALGSKPNMINWPGADLTGVQGLYGYHDLELMEKNTKSANKAVVVGGGLIGIEMAEMLQSRNIDTTLVVREKSFWNTVLPPEESSIINEHIRKHGFNLLLDTELKEIIGNKSGIVKAVKLSNEAELKTDFVGVTIGVSPNIDFLKDSILETNKGIKVNEYLETNIPDVYAIGDCAEFEKAPAADRRTIEQVWYTGRMQGETIAASIYGDRTAYKPGMWFNSAKFLDIEYQTYGKVPNQIDEEKHYHLFWKHEKGEKCLRLVFDKSSDTLIGVNSLGIRIRHAVIDKMITQKWNKQKVLKNISTINFDPEFFSSYTNALIQKYNEDHPSNPVKLQRKKKFGIF